MILQGDCLEIMPTIDAESVDAIVTDPPAGIGFMGKDWDHDKGGREQWVAWMRERAAECLRVLKPGGHALVWALPRTSHWTATAWEDAGFVVRDRIAHVFGSGFPKSLDVSKAIDREAGAERGVGEPGRYSARRPRGNVVAKSAYHDGVGNYGSSLVTAPATDAARQWQGWGTALKPAVEDWWLLRKPFSGTVAANVQKHGTGAINIDGCRVGDGSDVPAFDPLGGNAVNAYSDGLHGSRRTGGTATVGRFPANLIHDGSDEVVALFPDAPGQQADASTNTESRRTQNVYGAMKRGNEASAERRYTDAGGTDFAATPGVRRFDTGSAARFFYAAKASSEDRGEGCTHPTVKSVALMQYLCRLITPPGGLILDPFAGSGSTGKAALREGFRFIGIELNPEYAEMARKRIEGDAPLFNRIGGAA